MNRTSMRLGRVVSVLLLVSLAACSGSDDEGGQEEAAPAAEEGGALALADVCPDPIVLQKDWQPESEHGAWYNLIGEGYTIDAEAKSLTGPLVAGGEDTGVQLEIRTGGPAIGFQPPPAVLYTDESIHLAFVATDESVQFSAETPVTAVVAPLEVSPLSILWDAETHPEWDTIEDVGQTDSTVIYSQGLTYMDYLTGTGLLQESQLDGSYDGSPAPFVTAQGEAALQGFATSEPYIYSEEIEEWGKPLEFQLLHDTGYPFYMNAAAVRTGDLEELAPCLEKLVPIVQQSMVDFIADPDAAIEVILEAVEEYATGWVYSDGLARYTHAKMTELGIVGNGDDGTLGNFDMDRVREVIDIVTPIYTDRGIELADGLTPEDVVTNEFIDETIGM